MSTQRLTALVRQDTHTYICAQICFKNVLSKNSSELVSEVAKVGFTRPTLAHRNPWFGKRKDRTARNEESLIPEWLPTHMIWIHGQLLKLKLSMAFRNGRSDSQVGSLNTCSLVIKLCLTLCNPMACQAPLSMGFSRQEYWSELPFPTPGIFLTQGSNPHFLY